MKILNQNPNIQNLQEQRDPKILGASRGYEQQFLGQMVDAMRRSVQRGSSEPQSMAERIYKDQLYDQYVEQWANMGGVGLSDIIYDQIVERFAPHGTKQHHIQKLQGPMPLDNKKTFQVQPQIKQEQSQINQVQPQANSTQGQQKTTSMIFKITPQKNIQNEILSPWAGRLTNVQTLESGEKVAFLKHDNGLQSIFLFKGKLPQEKKIFSAGDVIASLDSATSSYTWKLS